MNYRTLGKSNIKAGIIGLGTEHLEKADRNTIASIVDLAIENEINYIDLLLADPDFRDNFGYAFKGKKDKVLIAGHLSALYVDGQYVRSKDVKKSEEFFYDMLKRFGTDYVDALMIHFVDEEDDFERTFGDNGLYELALRLKKKKEEPDSLG
ncbi:MAG: aldo/keto reductase [Thermotogota bacterium]|nr:aldo/keto reductase [Thermotogota bacterium]